MFTPSKGLLVKLSLITPKVRFEAVNIDWIKKKIKKSAGMVSFLPLVLPRSSCKGLISVAKTYNTPRVVKI